MVVMLVQERVSPRLITVHPKARLAEARALLDQHRIRHLPVVEEGRLVGIITDRDIRLAAAATSLEEGTVGAAMTKHVITVAPTAPIQEAAKLMVTHRIGGLPVLRDGTLVGIITETDLLKAFVELVEAATRRTLTVLEF